MSTFDGFKAISPDNFEPTPRRAVEEMLVGEQISRLVYFADTSMFQSAMAGLVCVSTERVCIMAAPGEFIAALRKIPRYPYRWGLAMTYFDRLTIVTPSMARKMRSDRRRVGDEPPDEVQKRVEGELILGVPKVEEPSKDGGERIRLELRHYNLWFTAEAPAEGSSLYAGLFVDVEDVVNREVFIMGDGRGKKR